MGMNKTRPGCRNYKKVEVSSELLEKGFTHNWKSVDESGS